MRMLVKMLALPVVSLRAKLTSFLSLTSITSKILMARTQVAVFIAILVILSVFSPEVTAAKGLVLGHVTEALQQFRLIPVSMKGWGVESS